MVAGGLLVELLGGGVMTDKKQLLQHFLHDVRLMRSEQKRYFATRTKTSLERSKWLEKRVDDALERIHSKQKELGL